MNEYFLFYKDSMGERAVGKLSDGEFTTLKTFPNGPFGNWNHVVCADGLQTILFYNSKTGEGAEGILANGDFQTTQTFNDFLRGWTHIVGAGVDSPSESFPLFYNAFLGSGAAGYNPTVQAYAAGSFARGWTHIVKTGAGLLFYNASTGEGAVAVQIDDPPKINEIKTVTWYDPGEFTTGWTQVVSNETDILFYNSSDGSGASGRLSLQIDGTTAFQTVTQYAAGSIAPGWTHIVPAEGGTQFLFYNAATGEGAIGEIADDRLTIVKTYPPDAFAKDWFLIVSAHADVSPQPP